jgi:hypothetical protein
MEPREEVDSTNFATADKHLNLRKAHTTTNTTTTNNNIHYVEMERGFPAAQVLDWISALLKAPPQISGQVSSETCLKTRSVLPPSERHLCFVA